MPRVFLADIFTVDTSSADIKINPWVLSPSLKKILGFTSKEIANEDSFKKEMEEFERKHKSDRLTLVPLKLYGVGRRIKCEIGLVRGKKKYDKRESIKKRDTEREIRRTLKN